MKKIPILLTLALLALTAETFNVSTTAEFRTALENAAQNGENDTIILADGTYTTTDDGQGTFKYIDNEVYTLTLKGSSRDNVILSGDQQNKTFSFQSDTSTKFIIENLSFIDGGPELDGDGKRTNDGGAISTTADMNISNCSFTNNHATNGGGIYAYGYDLNILNTVFTNNTSNSGFDINGGGGFFCKDATMQDSNFMDNSAYAYGGGFYVADNATIATTIFTNNHAAHGGGFYAFDYATIEDSKFNNNLSHSGGGFYIYGYYANENTMINNAVFNENNATSYGAGFYCGNSIIVTKSIFKKNTVDNGSGGGFLACGDIIVQDSIFDANEALLNVGGSTLAGTGGAFYSEVYNTVIVNSVFINNKSDRFAAAFYTGHLNMSNSMIAHNTDGIFLQGYAPTSNPHIIKNNIFLDNYVPDVSNDPRSDISGSDESNVVNLKNNYLDMYNVYIDKLTSNNIFEDVTLGFVDVENGDYHLTASSDLIDAGTNDFADKFIVHGVNHLEYDYEGSNRSIGKNMDIGIYEFYNMMNPSVILYLLN